MCRYCLQWEEEICLQCSVPFNAREDEKSTFNKHVEIEIAKCFPLFSLLFRRADY